MIKKITLIVFFTISILVADEKLGIYAGDNNEYYLGCLNCSKDAKDSIFNTDGEYGNSNSYNSMFNQYGKFGGAYKHFSPCNKYSKTPPKILDSDKNFYGYFTINTNKNKLDKDTNKWMKNELCKDSM